MNNRINDTITLTGRMRQIELAPATIFTYTFLTPWDNNNLAKVITNLANAYMLRNNGAIHVGETSLHGSPCNKWMITVKGDENSVEAFEREARRLD